MAFANGYDHDVFISYARVDNQPLNLRGDEIKWVDYFREQLEGRVNQALGRDGAAAFWFDDRSLPGNERVTEGIADGIEKTGVIVVLLSRGYLASDWCRAEISKFKQQMESANGPKNRIFIVHLYDFEYEERPDELKDLIGYRFFHPESKTELSPKKDEFSSELARLREDIAKCLTDLNDPPPAADKSPESPAEPSVFLAEPSPDLVPARNQLSVFVNKLGHRVTPARIYGRSREDFSREAAQDLATAKLFVQLLGPFGTYRTDDLPLGYEGLQDELAEHLPKIRAYYRDTFSWDVVEEEHLKLLESMDVMATTPSELESMIRVKLEEIALEEARSDATRQSGSEDRTVYVRTASADYDIALELCDSLGQTNLGYEIVEDEEPLESLAENQDPDGFLVVCGPHVERPWIKDSVRTVKNLRLDRRPREPACGIYVHPPHEASRLPIRIPFLHTIDSRAADVGLESFVSEVLNRSGI